MAAQQDRERTSDLAVMDANEFKQKRRLERILESLEKVETKADEAWELYASGSIDTQAKNIMIQRAVKQAIRESYNLLCEHQQEVEGDSEYWVGSADAPVGTIETPWGSGLEVPGLRGFLGTEEVYREEVVKRTNPRNKPGEVVRHEMETTVDERVSWNAFLRLKQFLSTEHDLEIRFEELDNQLPTWGFEEVESDAD